MTEATRTPDTGSVHIVRIDIAPWRRQLRDAVISIAASYPQVDDPGFLRRLAVLAREVPEDLTLRLRDLLVHERAFCVVVSGFPIEDWVGPTPSHWRERGPFDTLLCDVYLMLIGAQLGEPFAWQALQHARILNDVLPIRGEDDKQNGHSSRAVHDYHCDDAFHEFRCDYVALLCLRNPDRVATTVIPVSLDGMSPADVAVLRQPRFLIHSDSEHVKNSGDALPGPAGAVAVLSGAADAPRIRLDPPYMVVAGQGDDEARAALRRLLKHLEGSLVDVVLAPGDLCLIDNHRAVHGRAAFRARYDGTDRWLRKLLITRDLGKSRELRARAESRVITN